MLKTWLQRPCADPKDELTSETHPSPIVSTIATMNPTLFAVMNACAAGKFSETGLETWKAGLKSFETKKTAQKNPATKNRTKKPGTKNPGTRPGFSQIIESFAGLAALHPKSRWLDTVPIAARS